MILNTRARAGKITKTPGGSIFQEKVLQQETGASTPRDSQKSLKSQQRPGLLQVTRARQVTMVQERARGAEEEQPSPLEWMNTDSRTTPKPAQALKDKESVGGGQYQGNQATMHGPPKKTFKEPEPLKASSLNRDLKIKTSTPSPTPTPLEPSLWRPHLPQHKHASKERSPPLQSDLITWTFLSSL